MDNIRIDGNGDAIDSGGDGDDSGRNIGTRLEASSRHRKSLADRLGSLGSGRTRSRSRCSDRGSYIIMRVSPLHNMGVCFAIANQQTFLVIGHGFITIALEPLDHDIEVMIFLFACFWCGSFCQYRIHLLFQLDSF
jgi:hypothetical protein